MLRALRLHTECLSWGRVPVKQEVASRAKGVYVASSAFSVRVIRSEEALLRQNGLRIRSVVLLPFIRGYTRTIRHRVDIGAPSEKKVIE